VQVASAGSWLICAGVAVATVAPAAPGLTARAEYRLGQDMFSGAIDLPGRIVTHLVDLPPEVVRCANCHAAPQGPNVPRSLAPRLNRDLLLERRSRRGGPPSTYNDATFCALLNKGVDPAYIMINVSMPRYDLEPSRCRALWRFLTWSPNASNSP
jgi:hypothetical protein